MSIKIFHHLKIFEGMIVYIVLKKIHQVIFYLHKHVAMALLQINHIHTPCSIQTCPKSSTFNMELKFGKQRFYFSESSALKKQTSTQDVTETLVSLFKQNFDHDIVDIMVSETDKYARHYLATTQICRS